MKKIALLHTVRSVLNSFEDRIRKAMPDEELLIHNTLDEFLASDANLNGFTADNQNRLLLIMKALELEHTDLIVVTCSTLTPAVEKIRTLINVPVIAIDDAMSAKAVGIGSKIMVMATAYSTVEPTKRKLRAEAEKLGRDIEFAEIISDEAYTAIKRLDYETHDALLRKAAEQIKGQDVVVLAQASMAHMQEDIEKVCGCTTLSSIGLCVEQIKKTLS